ncbi:NAD-dependent epimerase/dehydratase family protein [Mucilaginibacter sp. HD30]
MKILITGICGFVGSSIAKELLKDNPGAEIFGVDNFSRSGSWINKPILESIGIEIYHADVRQASDLQVLPRADWVIDAAANPSVLAGVDGKTSTLQLIENNLFGTINLLEYCKKHTAGFILLSTSRVYSIPPLASLKVKTVNGGYVPDENQHFVTGLSGAGVSENFSTASPISLYGCTKLSSEQLALEYGITFGFPVWINRCGVMAGAGQFGHPGQGIFAYWIHSFKEQKELKYIGFNGTGSQVRDCLHPKDLIPLFKKQFMEALLSTQPRIINISGGIENSMSLAQLTHWCVKRYGEKQIISSNTERPFDIPWMVLDYSNAKKTWDWAPKTSITEICEEIAGFAETQNNWCDISSS